MELKITLTGAKELKATFLRAPGIAQVEYRKALDVIATTVQAQAIKNAPRNKGRTGTGEKGYGGNLAQSIKKQGYGATGFIVIVNSEYGVYVDQGTRPHVITPKNKNFLVFQTRSGGWARTKRVNHPGQKPTFFFTNAVKEGDRIADKEMSDAMDRVIRSL